MDDKVQLFAGILVVVIIAMVAIQVINGMTTAMTTAYPGTDNFTGNGTLTCPTTGCKFLGMMRVWNATDYNLTALTQYNVTLSSGAITLYSNFSLQMINYSFVYGQSSYDTSATNRTLIALIPLLMIIALIVAIVTLAILGNKLA